MSQSIKIELNEKQIETQILAWLNLLPDTFAFKINTVGVYDSARKIYRKNQNKFVIRGTADILGINKGRFLAIEVKTPITLKRWLRSPTESDLRQRGFLQAIAERGGIAGCVGSLDEVISHFHHEEDA